MLGAEQSRARRTHVFPVRAMLACVLLLGVVALPPILNRVPWPYENYPLTAEELARLAAVPGWEVAQLGGEPNVTLVGLVSRPSSASEWILFLPGNGKFQLASGQAYLDRLAAGWGWGRAVFALRGYDASTGTPARDALVADTMRVHKFLHDAYGAPEDAIHIIGFSFGSDLAFYLAAALTRAGHPPSELTLLSSTGTQMQWWMRRHERSASWSIPDFYDLTPLVGDLRMPMLVIESRGDIWAPNEMRDRLGDQIRYLELPGDDHNATLTNSEAIAAVREFVRDHAADVAEAR